MQLKRLCVLIFSASLAGCGLWGPNYTKPSVDTDAAWSSKDKLASTQTDADMPNLAWWKRFNDPILNELIFLALKNNTEIQQEIGSIIQAKGYLQQIQMGWVPTLSMPIASSSSGTFENTASNSASNANVGTNTGYSLGLIPSYSLNILNQIRTQEAAKAALLASRATKDAMRLTILSQVAGSYFTLSELRYELELQKSLVEDNAKLYTLAKEQYDQGYISLLSLQSYVQDYETAKAQIPIIENNIISTENALRVLINRNPGPIMLGGKFNDIDMTGVIPVNLPSTVLKQRPDVIEAEQQLIEANANIGVATSAFFPTITLTGGIGTASSELNSLFNANNNYWQAKIAATFPLIDFAQLGTIKSAKGAYYTAYYNYIYTIRNAFSEVDNGLAAHEKITNSYFNQQKQYDSTIVAYNLSDDNFHQGLYSELQELSAKVTMDNAAITLASLKLQQLQSIVNLYQALAGGYNVNNTEKPYAFGDARDAESGIPESGVY